MLPSKRRYKKKTFLHIFSYSLIICLFILLLSVGFLYYSFSRIVTKEINSKSIDLLNQTRLVFNSIHAWIIPSFRQIYSENLVAGLVHSQNSDSLQVSKALDRLDEAMSAYYLLHSVYIYNGQAKQYYSNINGYEGANCSDITLDSIIHSIRTYGVYRYIPRKMIYKVSKRVFGSVSNEVKTENVFSIVIGNIPDSGNTINGAMIVNISEKKIREYFLGLDSNSSSDLIVIDQNGKVLSHPDETEFARNYSKFDYVQRIFNSPDKEGVFTAKIDNEKYLVSYIVNPGICWYFINITPYGTIFADLNSFLRTAVFVFISFMFLAFLLTFLSSMRIYSPIGKLFNYSLKFRDKAQEAFASDNAKGLSELQAFDRIFKQIVKRVQDADHLVEDYRKLNKKEYIRRFLLGEMGLNEVNVHADLLAPDLDTGPYLLAVIRIDNFKHLLASINREEVGKLFNILEELIFHYLPAPHVFLHMRNETACVICNLSKNGKNEGIGPDKLFDLFVVIKDSIKERLSYSATIGLSDIFSDLDDFPDRYKTTYSATQYRFSFGWNSIITGGDISRLEKSSFLLPEAEVNNLFNEIKLGKASGMEISLEEILNSVKMHNYEDFNYLIHFLIYRTRKLIEEVKDSIAASYISLNEELDDIADIETIPEIRSKFSEIFSCVIESLQEKQSNKALHLAEKVKKYIDVNFKDVKLCTEEIAEKMGFSAQYIRFTYKNIYGSSILEYINSLRLQYCKEQLLGTRLPLKKIFRLAGYYNYSYFFTLFKKETGLTPNQFRLQGK